MPKEESRVEHLDPYILKSHPVNEDIYRDSPPDQEFLDNVAELGVVNPLICLPNNVVLSGHRRMMAARMSEQETVPVIRVQIEDRDEQARFLIMMNNQREKTYEQMAREFMILEPILMAAAEKRKGFSGEGDGRRSRDIAAQAVGFNFRTAKKAVAVLEEIKNAEEQGDEEWAALLLKLLNRSPSKAFKRIRREKDNLFDGLEVPVPDKMRSVFALAREIKGIIGIIGKARSRIEEFIEEPGGEHLPVMEIVTDLRNAMATLMGSLPYAICGSCNGEGCSQCEDLGWMHHHQWRSLPEALRKPAFEPEAAEE